PTRSGGTSSTSTTSSPPASAAASSTSSPIPAPSASASTSPTCPSAASASRAASRPGNQSTPENARSHRAPGQLAGGPVPTLNQPPPGPTQPPASDHATAVPQLECHELRPHRQQCCGACR